MGSGVFTQENLEIVSMTNAIINYKEDSSNDKRYNIDVIEVSNIALAIKNKQHTINVQLSLRCQNLPIVKAFGSIDSMVVIYKNQKQQKNQQQNYKQVGRTQIIKNQLNPKYIQSFILSFNQQKKQQIQFHIFNIINHKSQDLNQQKLIGKATINLDTLVQNQNCQIQIGDIFKKSSKTILKVDCIQYDGGNSKYQICLELNNFNNKGQLFYIIQVLKQNQWIPIARSQPIQLKKNNRFKTMEVPYNKFQRQDNSRIKIKIIELTKTKDQQQIGSTDQITIINIYTNDDKVQTQRVFQNGFLVGMITFQRWRKIIRDSFISYIVNGAHLNLIVAIDFTNSNSVGQSLHEFTIKSNGQQTNPYIYAIQEIVGVLQYFNYCNQIPLYGFGAKLPPFYKNVGNCFALNGNFFNPAIVGGVEQIIKCYKETLKKVKLHGPTKISQMIDLAIEYAQGSPQSPNYYVLTILTDGQINDFNETVDRIVLASQLPLSIIIVGIGDKDFELVKQLDSDASLLKSQRTGKVCERDIVDFIRLDDYQTNQGSAAITLARQVFDQIPKQFIDYMRSKNIKPNRQKKSLKAAKADFISQKIKQIKKTNQIQTIIPQFLQNKKKKMKKNLISLGFDIQDPLLQNLQIAMDDLNYFIQVHSQNKIINQPKSNHFVQFISIKEANKLEQYLQQKDLSNKKKTLEKLQKIQSNQYGRKIKPIQIKQQIIPKKIIKLNHPCLACQQRQISILHTQCGHASLCKECCNYRCPLCYFVNQQLIYFLVEDIQQNNYD